MTTWGKDRRAFFGGEYPYETLTTVFLPEGQTLSSAQEGALTSRAMLLLGDLEVNRRMAGLPSMATHYTEADGTYYEYGFIMGQPFVRVWPVAGGSTPGVYKPAIAYVPASTSLGSTFTYDGTAHLVNSTDVRASNLVSQYNRVTPGTADTIFARTANRMYYKGHGFVPIGTHPYGFLAMVVGDPTGETVLSEQTAGALILVTNNSDGITSSIYRAALPPYPAWKITGSSIYPNVEMGDPLATVVGGNAIAPCVGAPYVLIGSYPFADTLYVYRYTAGDGLNVGDLIASYPKATSGTIDLAAYTAASVSGASITASTNYSATDTIRRWPSGPTLNLVSVPDDSPIPLSGTITRVCSATGNMVYTTPIQQPVIDGASGAKAMNGAISSSISQTAALNYCGTSLTASESMTHSLTFSSANTMSITSTSGPTTYSGTETAAGEDHWNITTHRKALTLCFADAAFRVVVLLEKETTLTYTRDQSLSASGSFAGLSSVQIGWAAPGAGGYAVSWFAQLVMGIPPGGGMAGDPYPKNITGAISLTQTRTKHDKRDVVIYRSGVEVFRQTYYEATTSTWGSEDRLYTADPIRTAAGYTEPSSEAFGESLQFNFRTLPLFQINMESINQDRAIATCDANGVYVDVEWSNPTPGRLFVTHSGQDWAAQAGVPLGDISTASKLFRV